MSSVREVKEQVGSNNSRHRVVKGPLRRGSNLGEAVAYLVPVILVLAATALRLVMQPYWGNQFTFIFYFPVILLVSRVYGRQPALLAVLVSSCLALWLFLDRGPGRTTPFAWYDMIALLVYVVISCSLAFVIPALREAIERERLARFEGETKDELLRLVTDALPGLVAYIDRAGRFTFANKLYREAYGARRFEACPTVESIVGRAWPQVEPRLNHALAGIPQRFEIAVEEGDRLKHSLVQYIPDIAPGGFVRGVVSLVIDITESKAAQEAIRAGEERLLFALSAAKMSAWEWEPASDRMTSAYNAAKVMGLDESDVPATGAQFLERVHREDRERVAIARKAASLDGEEYYGEFRLRRGDGSYFWAVDRGHARRDDTGRIVAVSGVLGDISELKEAENRLAQARDDLEDRVEERTAQLIAANKELEAFAYSVSHDLRGPLRSIDGFAFALEEDCRQYLDASGRDYVERIRSASRRLDELITALLALSRVTRSELNVERIDLTELAASVVAELRANSGGRQVDFEIEPGLVAEGDSKMLRVLLDNLLRNAFKFTGTRDSARISFGSRQSGRARVFFVKDNGVGFDPEYKSKLFVPFERLHSPREFPGSGIGLATVQRIVQKHGGEIWAESAPDQGATFYFTLAPSSATRGIPLLPATG